MIGKTIWGVLSIAATAARAARDAQLAQLAQFAQADQVATPCMGVQKGLLDGNAEAI